MKLRLQETKELHEYQINLAEALNVDHSSYMFRLLIALNDLLSIHYLSSCFGKFDSPVAMQNGIESYLIRMLRCHIVEAYIAFVEKIQNNPADPVLEYLCTDDDLKKQFEALDNIRLENKHFKAMRAIRNSFGFHYNYRDHGEDTRKALDRLLQVAKSERSNGGEDLIVIDPHSLLILKDDYVLQTRFVCADRLVNEGMAMLAGLDELVNHNINPSSVEFKQSVGLAIPFIKFAQDAFLKWISDNNLQAYC
jgi:hypothetical protein